MGLIGHWTFNGDVTDRLGRYDGIPDTHNFVDGKIDQAFDFNASGALNIPLPLISKYQFSVSYWGRGTATPISDYRPIWILYDEDSIGYYRADIRTIASPYILHYVKDYYINAWSTRAMISNADYILWGWHHYILVVDGLTFRSYTDGMYLGQNTVTIDLDPYKNINSLIINSSTNNQFEMDDFKLFDHILADDEIIELSHAKVIYWGFDNFSEPTENMIPAGSRAVIPVAYTGTGYGILNLQFLYTTYGIADGDDFTFSFEGKVDSTRQSAGGSVRFYIYTRSATDSWISATSIGCANTYYEAKDLTFSRDDARDIAASDDGQPADRFMLSAYHYPSNIDDGTSYYKNLQVEFKNHSTPFIDGTRTAQIMNKTGNGYDITLTESTTPRWVYDDTLGKAVYEFDGTNYLDIGELVYMRREASTLFFRLKPDSSGTNYGLFSYLSSVSYYNHLQLNSTYIFGETEVNCNSTNSPGFSADANWHDYALVFEDNLGYWYRDGELLGEIPDYGDIDCNAGTPAFELLGDFAFRYIGMPTAYVGGLSGRMADIQLFSSAMDVEDISRLSKVVGAMNNQGGLWVK